MFAEQERNLRKGHDLPKAILRNVLEIHEELQAVEQCDHRVHAEKVRLDFETVLARLEREMSLAKRRAVDETEYQLRRLEEDKQAALQRLKIHALGLSQRELESQKHTRYQDCGNTSPCKDFSNVDQRRVWNAQDSDNGSGPLHHDPSGFASSLNSGGSSLYREVSFGRISTTHARETGSIAKEEKILRKCLTIADMECFSEISRLLKLLMHFKLWKSLNFAVRHGGGLYGDSTKTKSKHQDTKFSQHPPKNRLLTSSLLESCRRQHVKCSERLKSQLSKIFVNVVEAFVFFDINGDDLIQRTELKIQLSKLGINLNVNQVIWEIDGRTNDGCLDLNEFVDHMCWHPRLCMKELMMKYESTKANRQYVLLQVEAHLRCSVDNLRRCDHKKSDISNSAAARAVSACEADREVNQNNSFLASVDLIVSNAAIKVAESGVHRTIPHVNPTQGYEIDSMPVAGKAQSNSILPSSIQSSSIFADDSQLIQRYTQQIPALNGPSFFKCQVSGFQDSKLASNRNHSESRSSQERPEFVGPQGAYRDWDAVGAVLKNEDSTFSSKSMSSTGLWPSKPTRKFHTDVISEFSRIYMDAKIHPSIGQNPNLLQTHFLSDIYRACPSESAWSRACSGLDGNDDGSCSPSASIEIVSPLIKDMLMKDADIRDRRCHREGSESITLTSASTESESACSASSVITSGSQGNYSSAGHVCFSHPATQETKMLNQIVPEASNCEPTISSPSDDSDPSSNSSNLRLLPTISEISIKIQKELSAVTDQIHMISGHDLNKANSCQGPEQQSSDTCLLNYKQRECDFGEANTCENKIEPSGNFTGKRLETENQLKSPTLVEDTRMAPVSISVLYAFPMHSEEKKIDSGYEFRQEQDKNPCNSHKKKHYASEILEAVSTDNDNMNIPDLIRCLLPKPKLSENPHVQSCVSREHEDSSFRGYSPSIWYNVPHTIENFSMVEKIQNAPGTEYSNGMKKLQFDCLPQGHFEDYHDNSAIFDDPCCMYTTDDFNYESKHFCQDGMYPDTFTCLVSAERAIESFATESPRSLLLKHRTRQISTPSSTVEACLDTRLICSASKSTSRSKAMLDWVMISVRLLLRKRVLFVVLTNWAKRSFLLEK